MLENKVHHATLVNTIFTASLFCQKLSCKLPSRTTTTTIKLGTNSIWLEITHAMDMALPCKHKGVVP